MHIDPVIRGSLVGGHLAEHAHNQGTLAQPIFASGKDMITVGSDAERRIDGFNST